MSKLYWMDQVIASTNSEYIDFVVGSSGLTSTTVGKAIREVATNMTGIKMSKALVAGTTEFSFTNTLFTDSMYVDYFCDKDFAFDGFPTYNDSTKTITIKCGSISEACTFKIVAKF